MSLFSLSDFFLPLDVRDTLRRIDETKELSSVEDEDLSFTFHNLVESRQKMTSMFRTRTLCFLNVVYLAASIINLLFFQALGSPGHTHSLMGIAMSSLLLLTLRYHLCNTQLITMTLCGMSLALNFKMVLFPSPDGLTPFFQVFRTVLPMTPIFTLYHLGRRHSLFFIISSVLLTCVAFFWHLGEGDAPLTLERHSDLLTHTLMFQILPLLFFDLFDYEANLYHNLLGKLLENLKHKSNAKTTFISRMSHELRTPLHGLLSAASLLKQTELSEDQLSFLSIIDSCSSLLLDLVVKILDITRIESGKFESDPQQLSLLELTSSVLESVVGVANSKKVGLFAAFDVTAQSFDVIGEQRHIRGILTNLVGNAVKFTEAGSVVVSVAQTEEQSPEKGRKWFRFEITDTGRGISEESITRLFEPFSRVHEGQRAVEGSGLGLSIAKRFTEAIGGRIGVNSKPGSGSQFWFEIPLEVVPLGTVTASVASLPLPHQELEAVHLAVVARRPAASIWPAYLTAWRVSFELLDHLDQDLARFTHVLVDHDLDTLAQAYQRAKGVYPQPPFLYLAEVSSQGQDRRQIDQQFPCNGIQVVARPFSPLKLAKYLAGFLSASSLVRPSPSTSSSSTELLKAQGRASAGAAAAAAGEGAASVPASDIRVMLVEDNAINQVVMKKLFEKLGVSFQVYSTAEEALASWEGQRPHVILMDVELEGSMTGLEATQLIRQREELLPHDDPARTHVAIMTGRALEDDRRQALEAGCDDFLIKPVALDQVKSIILSKAPPLAPSSPCEQQDEEN